MLNRTQKTLSNIKNKLLRKQKEVEKQIITIETEDPVMQSIPEASESGTDSWAADVHARAVTLKNDLVGLSKKISQSVMRIKKGTYGKCDKCGNTIEVKRLKAMPTATLCISCSKKSSK